MQSSQAESRRGVVGKRSATVINDPEGPEKGGMIATTRCSLIQRQSFQASGMEDAAVMSYENEIANWSSSNPLDLAAYRRLEGQWATIGRWWG